MGKKYNIILADPPWRYSNPQGNDPKRGGITYPTMSIAELKALPVHKLAADNCVLFLWVTSPLLPEAFPIAEAWKFKYRTMAFDWLKLNPNGWVEKVGKDVILHGGIYSGLGSYTNQNNEYCLLCRRGRLPRVRKDIKVPVLAPRGRHSAKPTEVRDRIVRLYGDLPRVELFARDEADDGWDRIGNDYDGQDIKDVLENWDKEIEDDDAIIERDQCGSGEDQSNVIPFDRPDYRDQLRAA